MLREEFKDILEMQELDIQMIRLMRLKREREMELERIRCLSEDLHQQVVAKEHEIIDLKKQSRLSEVDIGELKTKLQKLEGQQSSVKKVEEFNALTQEISQVEREKAGKEARLSDLYDKQAQEEDLLKNLRATFDATKQNSEQFENEIRSSIMAINEEGKALQKDRAALSAKVNEEILAVYEKLLGNKKDRVIVPIENRCCSGCHILVTAQHENLVRKGEKLVFCEHCSRIHYWHDVPKVSVEEKESEGKASRRKKRAAVSEKA